MHFEHARLQLAGSQQARRPASVAALESGFESMEVLERGQVELASDAFTSPAINGPQIGLQNPMVPFIGLLNRG